MPSKSIVKKLLEFKCTAIDKISYEGDKVIMDVHPTKNTTPKGDAAMAVRDSTTTTAGE